MTQGIDLPFSDLFLLGLVPLWYSKGRVFKAEGFLKIGFSIRGIFWGLHFLEIASIWK